MGETDLADPADHRCPETGNGPRGLLEVDNIGDPAGHWLSIFLVVGVEQQVTVVGVEQQVTALGLSTF